MDIQELYKIRNMLLKDEGCLLITFLSDYITENACKQRNSDEIKGMCELLHKIKTFPDFVDARKS